MIDATPLYPKGFHPAYNDLSQDTASVVKAKRRVDVGTIKYYFIDFGLSCFTTEKGEKTIAIGRDCQDQDVPELSDFEPFEVRKLWHNVHR